MSTRDPCYKILDYEMVNSDEPEIPPAKRHNFRSLTPLTEYRNIYFTLNSLLSFPFKEQISKNVPTLHQQRYQKVPLQIFLLNFILTVFKHKYLNIRTTHEAQHIKTFCYEERPFNRKEKVSCFILPEILVKNA